MVLSPFVCPRGFDDPVRKFCSPYPEEPEASHWPVRVSHAGFLLIGVIAARTVDWASTAILFYLFAYLLASAAVFSVLVHLNKDDDSDLTLDDLGDLAKKNGFLGLALAVGVGSLAGIPPLAGFIGKLLIFIAAFKAELYGLLGVAIFGVVVSIYYYFGILKKRVFRCVAVSNGRRGSSNRGSRSALGFLGKVAIVIAIAGTLLLRFLPVPFQ